MGRSFVSFFAANEIKKMKVAAFISILIVSLKLLRIIVI